MISVDDIENNLSLDGDDFAVLIGNREWMVQNTIPLPKQVDQLMTRQEEQGQTAVLVAVDGILIMFELIYLFLARGSEMSILR